MSTAKPTPSDRPQPQASTLADRLAARRSRRIAQARRLLRHRVELECERQRRERVRRQARRIAWRLERALR